MSERYHNSTTKRLKLINDFSFMFYNEIREINRVDDFKKRAARKRQFISGVVVHFIPYTNSSDKDIWTTLCNAVSKHSKRLGSYKIKDLNV